MKFRKSEIRRYRNMVRRAVLGRIGPDIFETLEDYFEGLSVEAFYASQARERAAGYRKTGWPEYNKPAFDRIRQLEFIEDPHCPPHQAYILNTKYMLDGNGEPLL